MRNIVMPRSKLLARIVPLAMLFLVSTGLQAEPAMTIFLTGASEVPAVITAATASGQITILPDRSVSGSITTAGLTPTMAHIHEGAVGKNGPPIITLNKGANNSYEIPAGTRLSEPQYKSFSVGNLYVNVHSAEHPDGEIRAQLLGKPLRLAK